jgi:tripartite-type tricarboxylate transporter receptor subunit TctC
MRMAVKSLAAMSMAFVLAAATPAASQGNDYPNRTVRILVGFAAGGATDILARALGDQLRKKLNQSFIIENKAGAGGAIAATELARSKPDGYTLMVTAGSALTINVHIPPKPSYDTLKDFQAISQLVANDGVLAVHKALPVNDFKEFLAYAKANPGKLSYGISGIGSPTHLGTEMLNATLGISMVPIPYRGDAQVAVDLMSGTVPVGVMALPSVVGQLKDGHMRPIAVLGNARYSDFPDVPNIAELGYPDRLVQTWIGLVGPAGMPDAVLMKLGEATHEAMQGEQMQALMKSQSSRVVTSTPREFADFIGKEFDKWGELVRKLNINSQ